MSEINVKVTGTTRDAKKLDADMHHNGRDVGLVVFTEELRDKTQKSAFAINPEHGFEMAVDGQFGGVADVVHIGISDGVKWTGSNIIGGKGNFDSGDRANSGTVSVKWNNPALNDVIEFDKGSDLVVTSHVAITMFINIDKDWSVGDSISLYAYDTGTASTVGSQILIEDYVNEFSFDIWQGVTIPFADLGLSETNFDAIRLAHVGKGGGKSPKFYIDDFQIEATGTPSTFKIEPNFNEIFNVTRLTLTFIDALDNTLTASSTPNLSYDKILGLTKLTTGIQLLRIQAEEIKFGALLTCIGDLTRGGATLGDNYGDGNNTVVSFDIDFSVPVPLEPRSRDSLSITISDDLTGLISFTALARGYSTVRF